MKLFIERFSLAAAIAIALLIASTEGAYSLIGTHSSRSTQPTGKESSLLSAVSTTTPMSTTTTTTRRSFWINLSTTVAATFVAFSPSKRTFAAETTATSSKPQEFVNVGTQAPPPAGEQAFRTLDDGVKIKEFRLGTGDASVGANSRVDIQCSGRLLNLNGVVFYNTKNNNRA